MDELTHPPTPPLPKEDRQLRTARHNCIAVFVAFVCMLAVSLSLCAAAGAGAIDSQELALSGGCSVPVWAIIIIYAAFYIPMRRRAIMRLPTPVKVLGLVGLTGLTVLLAAVPVLVYLLRAGILGVD